MYDIWQIPCLLFSHFLSGLENTSYKETRFLLGIASSPPPIQASCTTFLDVRNDVLTRITETSNDDCDNDWSDNCDYNFDTFDDFGVKNGKKVYT